MLKQEVVWSPQRGPQQAYIDCPYPLVGFGGARGGGKSNGVLGKWAIKAETYGPGFNGVFFRKEMPQQDDLIEDAKEIYLKLGARWYEQKKMFRFEGGGRIRFRSLESDADAEKYQGQNLTDAAVEEAGNYPDPGPIWKLFGCLRSKHGTPIQLTLTWNPGGPGHWWIKEKFWDPAPGGLKTLILHLPTGKEIKYTFIPSKVTNNKILLANDPDYIDRLHLVGNKELVRAWLEGDMEIHVGAYFDEFSQKHLIEPFPIPTHWPKYLGYDWGFKSPACAVWAAVSSGRLDNGSESEIPKGALVVYREYKNTNTANVEQARVIKDLTGDEEPLMVADPSIFKTDGGMSIADQFRQEGVIFRRADNHRISGWNEIRKRLASDPPMLYFFNTLEYLRSSLPSVPMCPKNNEDVDTTADDHACLIGNTKIITPSGLVEIRDFKGGEVYTTQGLVKATAAIRTSPVSHVFKLTLNSGQSITATADHKFLTNTGYKMLIDLRPGDSIRYYDSKSNLLYLPRIQWKQVLSLWKVLSDSMEPRVKAFAQGCMGALQRFYPFWIPCTPQRQRSLKQQHREFRSPASIKTPKRPYDSREEGVVQGVYEHPRKTQGDRVAQVSRGESLAQQTCQTDSKGYAIYRYGVSAVWSWLSNKVKHEKQIKILPPKLQSHSKAQQIKSIERAGIAPVYCIYVPGVHNFLLEGGIVSHNCDALRYLCKQRALPADYQATIKPDRMGSIKISRYISERKNLNKKPQV